MTLPGPETVLLVFVLFCRIGGCLMLMPGFSSPRVPLQVRLFMAIATTLALAPLLLPGLEATLSRPDPAVVLALLMAETITGVFIGLLGRIFFLALQFMAAAISSFIGYSGFPEMSIEEVEPNPAVANLITVTATVLFFVADVHWEVLRGLVQSYSVLPVSSPVGINAGLARLVDATSDAFTLALQISSPFVVYALAMNLTFGIVNKLTPQIPVYFISLPFVIAGGLFLMYFAMAEFLTLFTDAVSGWLRRG